MNWFSLVLGTLSLAREIVKYIRERDNAKDELENLKMCFKSKNKSEIDNCLKRIDNEK